jgi:alpha-1,3-rhamnosyl/mannosyltransferase
VSPFSARQHLALPALAHRQRLDLLHSPYFIRPYLGLPCPSVVTIYDLIGRRLPRTLSWRGRLLYNAAMSLSLRTADAVITISESARGDLARHYPSVSGRVAVTPLAAGSAFRPQPEAAVTAMRSRYNLPPRYLLYLGSNKPHKNLARLLEAWEQVAPRADDATLLIAGHQDAKHSIVAAAPRRMLLPNVADDDLPGLYSGAELFVFPSLYEGFGLPPLEAMACGTPVLCANSSSLPEVVGDAALLVNPYDSGAIAAGLERLLGDAALRAELRERGLRRAAGFSWRRTAEETVRVYERVAG